MRQSLLVATAILVIFIVSVGANVVNVNAGRSHPLQTVGPGYCVPNQVSVQEMCPDKKTWKRGLVCINGQLVPQTQDCPTEKPTETAQCNAGDPPKDVWVCAHAYDDTQWYKRKECVNGVWKEVTNPTPCPECNGFFQEKIVYCPNDPTKWEYLLTCIKGHIVEERQKCGGNCKPFETHCISECLDPKDKCRDEWNCVDGSWVSRVTGQCNCYIATATYGSVLSPEVQLLRNFRDRDVLQTFAGSNFMRVFNMVYYSFSPQVARTISTNENLRTTMRYILYPLIGILWATQQIYSAFAFGPEGAVVITGIFAGSLIGLVYASPVILGVSFAIARTFRKRPTRVHVYMLLPFLAIATSLIIVSELTRFVLLMQVSTSLLMLTTWALPGIALSAWALNRRRPVTG